MTAFGFRGCNWVRRWEKEEQACQDTLCLDLWMVMAEGLGLPVEKWRVGCGPATEEVP